MPYAFLQRAGARCVESVPLRGMFLGTELHLPYQETRFRLESGDRLLLLSDGLLEQADGEGEMVEAERAGAWFAETAGLEPEAALDRLFDRMDRWRGEVPQSDDATLLYLEVLGAG
jgi:sigma-B regulation protein RsbU (phosphoserine phosphatase)